MPNWFTAVPGTALTKEERTPLIERFKQTFVAPDERHLPFWFSFPVNPTQRELLLSPRLSDLPQLYLMLGRGIELHVVTGSQVREFFTKQDPNDNVDIYVFDDSFGWCVCSPGGRHHRLRVEDSADELRVSGVVAKPSVAEGIPEVALLMWQRNRTSTLVGFRLDPRGRLIGEAMVPKPGLSAHEFQQWVRTIAAECDRFEQVLTGRDVE